MCLGMVSAKMRPKVFDGCVEEDVEDDGKDAEKKECHVLAKGLQ